MTLVYLIIIIALIITVYIGGDKIKKQDVYIKYLLEEKSKMSDKFRLKGIVIDRLAERIKKVEKKFNIRIVG